jgi:hypothetical protein
MHTVSCTVGRLVEVRLYSMRTLEEALAYLADLKAVFARVRGPLVSCGDMRQNTTEVYSPEVAASLVSTVGLLNSRVERAALIVPCENATFHLQTERMVRESGHKDRRSFVDPAEAKAWLSSALTREERARLERFIDEGTGPNASRPEKAP